MKEFEANLKKSGKFERDRQDYSLGCKFIWKKGKPSTFPIDKHGTSGDNQLRSPKKTTTYPNQHNKSSNQHQNTYKHGNKNTNKYQNKYE